MSNNPTGGAPFCNVSIATPPADPQKPVGLQRIPPGSSTQQIINIVNNNFSQLIKGNYTENRALRTTVITRIFDPANTGAFVDVAQVTGVTWVNGLTGQLIHWKQ